MPFLLLQLLNLSLLILSHQFILIFTFYLTVHRIYLTAHVYFRAFTTYTFIFLSNSSKVLSKSQKTRLRRKRAHEVAELKRTDFSPAPHKISNLARKSRHLQRTACKDFKHGLELSKQACVDSSDTSIFGPRAEAKFMLEKAKQRMEKSIEVVNTVRRMKEKQQIEPDVKEALHDVVFRGKLLK